LRWSYIDAKIESMKDLILASASPRRKEILENAGLNFKIIPSEYDETIENKDFSYEKIENLAKNKGFDVANKISSSALIISADTVVVLNGTILTKPKDYNDAFNTLKALSDKEHKVITSICVLDNKSKSYLIKSVTTKVEFYQLTDTMIENYITKFKPYDKAGSYGIQELPKGFVKTVEGSLENVIGICSKAVLETILQLESLA